MKQKKRRGSREELFELVARGFHASFYQNIQRRGSNIAYRCLKVKLPLFFQEKNKNTGIVRSICTLIGTVRTGLDLFICTCAPIGILEITFHSSFFRRIAART